MNIDPVTTAGLVAREVHTGTREGTPTKIAVARRTFATDPKDLWDALTDPERIPRWFLPVTGDLTVGGRYQLQGNAGGVVERCEPPRSFALTWEFGGMVSWVEVQLSEDGAGTRLELRHEAHVDPDLWGTFGPGAVGVGWDLALIALGLHLRTGEQVDPEAGANFPLTPDGLRFVQLAASGWAEAAVADGDEPGAAHEAARRTVGFYTTVPEENPAP